MTFFWGEATNEGISDKFHGSDFKRFFRLYSFNCLVFETSGSYISKHTSYQLKYLNSKRSFLALSLLLWETSYSLGLLGHTQAVLECCSWLGLGIAPRKTMWCRNGVSRTLISILSSSPLSFYFRSEFIVFWKGLLKILVPEFNPALWKCDPKFTVWHFF